MKIRIENGQKIIEYQNGTIIRERYTENPPGPSPEPKRVSNEEIAAKLESLETKIDALLKVRI